jgi:2-oxoisovalerate dehydrogenase E1 component
MRLSLSTGPSNSGDRLQSVAPSDPAHTLRETTANRDPLEVALTDAILGLEPGAVDAEVPGTSWSTIRGGDLPTLFDAQVESRQLDLAARWMRAQGCGFYTIGSAGHESNAAVAMALRPTDPALLHYRSGGFYCARARQVEGIDPVRDILLGMLAGAEEPIAGGRHKVFGRHELAIIPQTSTIASHLPRAMGVAFTIGRARKLGAEILWPEDAVVVCSFGDASANHSTAVGAINAACHAAFAHLPMPLLLVCEDNGLGVSVRTPQGWIEAAYRDRPRLTYVAVDGDDPASVIEATGTLVDDIRRTRRPAFLHLKTVRYMGHAGSDVEASYRARDEIRSDYARDPILGTARRLVGVGAATPADLVERIDAIRTCVRDTALKLLETPQLTSAEAVIRPLSPRTPDAIARAVAAAGDDAARRTWFGGTLPEHEGPLGLSPTINRTLADILLAEPRSMVFGEDVAVKGGVYGVTRGLHAKAGAGRVFDTLLDEQSILGLALGAAVSGLVPIPEIQYLAYVHNAEDQLRGEAASLSYFSQGQYRNGMVVRVAGLAYQKGFGGHFHNDNAVGVLRDIPGLVIASPGRPEDAAAILRTCVAAAATDGTVSVFLEPIALYLTRDLHGPDDGGWLAPYVPPGQVANSHVPIGQPRVHGDGSDLLIVTWANGLYMSLRVAKRLEAEGIGCRVLDLRWLAPLPYEELAREAEAVGRVLVVDETRASGGVGEAILAGLVEHGFRGSVRRVCCDDTFIPLGDAANLVLVGEDDIERAARELVAK